MPLYSTPGSRQKDSLGQQKADAGALNVQSEKQDYVLKLTPRVSYILVLESRVYAFGALHVDAFQDLTYHEAKAGD